jgi:hypothetical protein
MEIIKGSLHYEEIIKELIDMVIETEIDFSNSGNCKISYEDRMKTDCYEKGCGTCTREYYAKERKTLLDKYLHTPKTINDFSLEQLNNVATLLRSKDINIDDIKRMTQDITYVIKLMVDEQQKTFEKSMEHLTNQFKK